MKIKCLFIAILGFICLSSIKSYSQVNSPDTKNYSNEFSISVDNIFAKPSEIDDLYLNNPFYLGEPYMINFPAVEQNIPTVGLGYKLNFKNSALRFNVSFGSSQNKSTDSSEGNSTALTSQLKVGYEFHKNINKIQMFFGMDLLVSYDKLSYKYIDGYYTYDNYGNIIEEPNYVNMNYNSLAYGASPFFGVKYFVMPNLSISTELNFTIEVYKSSIKYSEEGNPEKKTDENGFNTHLGPIGNIGINLYF